MRPGFTGRSRKKQAGIMTTFDSIAIGDKILIPIFSKGKRLMATEYAVILDLPKKRSGEPMVLVQRPFNPVKMVFTKDQLEKFWQEYPGCVPVLRVAPPKK